MSIPTLYDIQDRDVYMYRGVFAGGLSYLGG